MLLLIYARNIFYLNTEEIDGAIKSLKIDDFKISSIIQVILF